MPIDLAFGNLGTEANRSYSNDYCSFCYKEGSFTNPDQTLEEMIQSSIDFMTGTMHFTPEMAAKMSNDVIPQLKRWKDN